mmetsp:Transcript_14830/g.32323  ORF Transcript_14830/g.32323 Transcript_14830/m.32323 type:complete len:296 (-) Transcript_14830:609-1496(-)
MAGYQKQRVELNRLRRLTGPYVQPYHGLPQQRTVIKEARLLPLYLYRRQDVRVWRHGLPLERELVPARTDVNGGVHCQYPERVVLSDDTVAAVDALVLFKGEEVQPDAIHGDRTGEMAVHAEGEAELVPHKAEVLRELPAEEREGLRALAAHRSSRPLRINRQLRLQEGERPPPRLGHRRIRDDRLQIPLEQARRLFGGHPRQLRIEALCQRLQVRQHVAAHPLTARQAEDPPVVRPRPLVPRARVAPHVPRQHPRRGRMLSPCHQDLGAAVLEARREAVPSSAAVVEDGRRGQF